MTDASGSLGVNIGGNERAGTSKGDLLNELIDTHLNIRSQRDELYEIFKRRELLKGSFGDQSCAKIVKQRYQEELDVLEERYKKLSREIEDGEGVVKVAAQVIMERDELNGAYDLPNQATASLDATNKLSTELDTRIQEFRQNLYTLDVLNEGHVAKLNKRIDGLSHRVSELQETLHTVNSTLGTVFTILGKK
ncbi:hypothetical protein E3P77_03522 [Wallemia ichthyophaga]|nr:hypothetical protein E3P96_02838 [Wallemia ichthyophaga]TIB63397.1 hypothetical protein E3P77_03522 [Wallemia ichthyophaga]